MSWFEKKFGKYAIKNLSLYIIICYGIGYLLMLPAYRGIDVFKYLYLNPQLIIDNFQIWRLFTWVLVPSGSGNIFIELLLLYFFYMISQSVESAWGTYKYNVYIFSGILYTILSAFIIYFVELILGNPFFMYGGYYSTYYITMSIFLALAATFPDNQILVFFIIPIKMKYLGIIYVVILIYQSLVYLVSGQWAAIVVMFASLLNFIIFYFTQKKKLHMPPVSFNSASRMKKKQVPYGSTGSSKNTGRTQSTGNQISRHKCAICGKTDITHPDASFRFCSKCNGNYEYCEMHLFTHTHVQ